MAASPIVPSSPIHSIASSSTDVHYETRLTSVDDKVKNFSTTISPLTTQSHPASFQMTTELKGHIQKIANSINEQGIHLLGNKISDHSLAKNIIDTLRSVDSYARTAHFNESFLKVEIHGNQDVKHVYISLDTKNDTILLIFGKNKAHNITPGGFKKLQQGIAIGKNHVESLIMTKEVQQNEGVQSSGFREERALTLCKEKNIPGTPSFHFIKNYTQKPDKEGNVKPKQAILMEFLPGGGLDANKSLLTPEKKLHVARQLSETISELHKHGVSYNDLKDENIVLDKDGSPVLIDYGAATVQGEKESLGFDLRFTGTLYTFPPEMFLPEERENLMHKIGGFLDAKDKLSEIEREYDKVESDYNTIYEQLDESPLDDTKRMELESQAMDLLPLMDKLSNDYSQTKSMHDTLIDDIALSAQDKKDINGWVPQKNDDYALGVVLKGLFGNSITPDIKEIVDGLLDPNPNQRMTSQMAFNKFQSMNQS